MTHLQLSTGNIVRYAVSDMASTKVDGAISALVHDSSTRWVEFPANYFNIHALEQFVAHRLEREPLVYGEKEQRFAPRTFINGAWQAAMADMVQR